MKFKLHSNYQPRGDQPAAIDQLYSGVEAGEKHLPVARTRLLVLEHDR